jgi:hypothetical protein
VKKLVIFSILAVPATADATRNALRQSSWASLREDGPTQAPPRRFTRAMFAHDQIFQPYGRAVGRDDTPGVQRARPTAGLRRIEHVARTFGYDRKKQIVLPSLKKDSQSIFAYTSINRALCVNVSLPHPGSNSDQYCTDYLQFDEEWAT